MKKKDVKKDGEYTEVMQTVIHDSNQISLKIQRVVLDKRRHGSQSKKMPKRHHGEENSQITQQQKNGKENIDR